MSAHTDAVALIEDWVKGGSLDSNLFDMVQAVRAVLREERESVVIGLVTNRMKLATGLSTRALRLTEP